MKIFIAADHAGFELKEQIKSFLQEKGFEVEDCGAYIFDKTDDYPDLIVKAAMGVAKDPDFKGIVFGKSGAGECIVANKIRNIRAVLGVNKENVTLSRSHNDANILSLGAIFVNFDTAKELVNTFLDTPFVGEVRHARRINKIRRIEHETY